jgi:hypothetical protein
VEQNSLREVIEMKLVSWELARAATALGLHTVSEPEAQNDVLIVPKESDFHGYLLSRLLLTMIDRIEKGTLKNS